MASAQPLTDHEQIRQWAEARGGRPACVKGTGGKGKNDVGMIRLDFPGFSGAKSLQDISWDEWFQRFDDSNLALIVQDTNSFHTNKLVNGTFALQQELRVKNNAGVFQTMPAGLKFWGAPTAAESVPLEFRQSIGANEPLRTGSYSKNLTFTLSTTDP